MNFGFTEEQEMLRESARRLLEAECSTAFVRKMMEHETAHSAELWKRLADLGWLGLLIPHSFGGMGGSLVGATPVLEEMGKALLPGPFFATAVLGAVALSAAGSAAQKKELLPRVAGGAALLTLAFAEDPYSCDASGIRLEAKRRGRDYVLRGEKVFVFDAAVADYIVVAARTTAGRKDPQHGITLFLVERGVLGLSITPLTTIDKTRRQANLTFDRVCVPAERVIGRVDRGWPSLSRALQVGTAALCVETVGVAQRALELSVAYAGERTQFGKPIGSFQAIKHKCVDMMVSVENARSLGYYAAWALDRRSREAPSAVAMAKAYTSDAGKDVTADSIQVHGGIGFTWEHDIHLYYRRALANEATLGSAPVHRESVARRLGL
jgi:alkylation response protein AidB-like acyl-CoA dehydrogenase